MPAKKPKGRWAGLDAHLPKPWKEPTHCIFCGVEGTKTPEGKLTYEHVFSDWTRRYVPRTTKKHNSLRLTAQLDRTNFVIVKRPGDVHDTQVRCVCEKCNNGWMRKKVDEAAKTILTALIQGHSVRLTVPQQRLVATWAVMKAMVAEYADSAAITTHHMQRKRMRKLQLPPANGWAVWIAHYVRNKGATYWTSTPFLILDESVVAKRPDRHATYYNSQVSTQVIGQLFLHVVRSPMKGMAQEWRYPLPRGHSLFRIWPPTSASILWPTGTLNDRSADFIANHMYERLLRIAEKLR